MGRGRPMSPRSVELMQMLDSAEPGATIAIKLTDAEEKKFLSFSTKIRHIAQTLGRPISLSHTKHRPNIAVITVEPESKPEHPDPVPEPETHPEPEPAEPKPKPYKAAVPPEGTTQPKGGRMPRAFSERTKSIQEVLRHAVTGDTVEIEMSEYEQENYQNFYMRVRRAAQQVGIKAKVGRSTEDPAVMLVKIQRGAIELGSQHSEEPSSEAIRLDLPEKEAVPAEVTRREIDIEEEMLAMIEALNELGRHLRAVRYDGPGDLGVVTMSRALIRSAALSAQLAFNYWDAACSSGNFTLQDGDDDA